MKVSHRMKLKPEPFKKVSLGVKEIELRLFDNKRKELKIGDAISFKNMLNDKTIIREVLDLIQKEKFSDIFNEQVLKERAGFHIDDNVDVLMGNYYTEEQVSENGVLGLFVRVRKTEPCLTCLPAGRLGENNDQNR